MALDKVLSTSIANGAVTAAAISNTANLVVGSISANGAELTSINATSISTGTLDTARLPATANIATAVNVGANVNITTTGISVTSGKILLGNNTTQTADISFPTDVGVKLDLYNNNDLDRYSITIQPSELRITTGILGASSGGITFGKANSSVFTENMRIRNDGIVTKPFQPSFKAGRSSTQTISAGQAIIFNSVFHNIGSHYNSSTGVFTAPVSGTYLFTATVLVQGSSTGWDYDLILNTSNSGYYGAPGRIEYQLGTSWGDGYIAVGAYHLAYMDVNDTAWIGFQTFGGGQIYGGTAWTNFAGMLIG